MKTTIITPEINEYEFQIENISEALHAKGENVFMALSTLTQINSTAKIISVFQITADDHKINITEYVTTN